jgi:hypothetical protein
MLLLDNPVLYFRAGRGDLYGRGFENTVEGEKKPLALLKLLERIPPCSGQGFS